MFSGVFAALFTPLDENDCISEKMLREHVSWLAERGVAGVYLCGSTGQGPLLSVAERKQLAEWVKDEAGGRLKIIAHVAAVSTRDAQELVRHANELGLDGLSSLMPLFGAVSTDEIIEFYRDLNRDSSLPFLMYMKFGESMLEHSDLVRIREAGIPNLSGFKFTHPNFFAMQRALLAAGGEWIALSGPDELSLPALTMGASGSIGMTQNALPEVFVAIYEAFRKGEIRRAMALQEGVTRIVSIYRRTSGLHAAKTILSLRGLPLSCCRRPARPRLDPALEECVRDEAKAVLESEPFREVLRA